MDNDITANSLLSAALPIGGGIINAISGSKANKTNLQIAREYNQAQRELAEYQAQWNEQMWNRQNEYNTPSAQMQRFKDAGLNPNLIYGQGSPGNATGAPSYPEVKQTAPSVRPVIQDGLGLGQAMMSYLQTQALQLDNKKRQQNLDLYPYQQQLAQLKVFNEGIKQTLQNQQIARNAKQLSVLDRQLEAQTSAAEQTLNNLILQGELSTQKLRLNEEANQRAWQAMSQRERSLAIQSALLELKQQLQGRLLPAQEQRLSQQVFLLEKQNRIAAVEAKFEEALGKQNSKIAIQLLHALISAKK